MQFVQTKLYVLKGRIFLNTTVILLANMRSWEGRRICVFQVAFNDLSSVWSYSICSMLDYLFVFIWSNSAYI